MVVAGLLHLLLSLCSKKLHFLLIRLARYTATKHIIDDLSGEVEEIYP